MTRLATLALADGSTVAARRDGGSFHAFRDLTGERYADVGALLRIGLETVSTETGTIEGRALRPVLEPGAVACVGINYGAHIAEMGRETPTSPTFFLKLARALTDPDEPVVLPRESSKVDYEGEVAAVIGRGGRRISPERALDHVAGLTLVNDVSMRDFQNRSLQWFAGKSWQGCTPVGPEVVTLDELGDLDGLEMSTTVNGELRQQATIGDLVFGIPALVADLSNIVELEPGDLIVTGTPGGVGHAMDPPRYLQPGDVVEVSVDGLGTLRDHLRRRHVILDPSTLDRGVLNRLMNGLVAPRPIAWVSTIGAGGVPNLAPFSFFNAFSFHPYPTVGIGPGARAGIDKDTLANCRATGELAISVVTEELAERANACSAEFDSGVDEWDVAGVTPAASETIEPPRVAESPAAFECRVHRIVDLGSDEVPSNALVIARVTRIYVSDDALDPELRPLTDVLRLVGRAGGDDWVRTRDRFELRRPVSTDPAEVAAG